MSPGGKMGGNTGNVEIGKARNTPSVNQNV
jgi:hypothetical protein